MKRVRIEGDSPELIAGFVAGVEWVDDSAITVVDLDDSARSAFVVLEDEDGSGEDADRRLTVNGIEAKEWGHEEAHRGTRGAPASCGALVDSPGALAPALEPALSRVGRHVACPVHGGTDGFRLFRDADRRAGVCATPAGPFPTASRC